MNEREYIEYAAKQSRRNASLWFRYLNKMLTSPLKKSYKEELKRALKKKELDSFQRIIVRIVLEDEQWEFFVEGLNKKTEKRWIKEKYGL